MPYFANYGTKDQKDYYMPKLVSGEMVSAIAMTEPGKQKMNVKYQITQVMKWQKKSRLLNKNIKKI